MRVLVAIFGIPLIFSTIWIGKWAFVALVAAIVLLAQYEFYLLGEKKGGRPLKIIGTIFGFLIVLSFYLFQGHLIPVILSIAVLLIMIVELFRNKPNALVNQAVCITGLIYPAALFSFLILIRESSVWLNRSYQYGAYWVLAILVTTWVCDTAAFFVGSQFGKHKLFPRVSPNKTIEGAVGGFLFALLTMFVINLLVMKNESLIHLLVVGAICGSFGQIGDLVESLLKRDAGVKDSSNFLPGHGGLLDRFDSIFFNAPLTYIYLKFIIAV